MTSPRTAPGKVLFKPSCILYIFVKVVNIHLCVEKKIKIKNHLRYIAVELLQTIFKVCAFKFSKRMYFKN